MNVGAFLGIGGLVWVGVRSKPAPKGCGTRLEMTSSICQGWSGAAADEAGDVIVLSGAADEVV